MHYAPWLLAFLLVLLFPETKGQNLHQYDQFVKNNKVGTLTVRESQNKDRREILIHSELALSFLFKVSLEIEQASVFEKNILQSSSLKVIKNGKPYKNVLALRKNGRYLINLDGKEQWLDRPSISFTSASLYLAPPVQVSEVFSESFGDMNTVAPVPGNKDEYLLTVTSNGYQNRYWYTGHQLVRAVIGHWLAPVTLVLRE